MYSDMAEGGILGKPLLWPVVVAGGCFAPCFPGPATKAMYEDKFDLRLRWRVKKIEAKGASWVVDVDFGGRREVSRPTAARCIFA